MANYTFDSNDQGWTSGPGNWTGAEGAPPGCMDNEAGISGLSISISAGQPMSFDCRIIATTGDVGQVTVDLLPAGVTQFGTSKSYGSLPYDSGWFRVSQTEETGGTVTGLAIAIALEFETMAPSVFFDNVYIAEAAPPLADALDLIQSAGGIPGSIMVST